MPQHRALPDFVSKNHLRTNFYDDEKNAPVIIEGLKFMHQNGWAHRDISPDNLLLDENFNLKIADFGFTTRTKEGR